MPQHYSRAQIRLHWAIFVLIVLQFVLHDPISDAWSQISKGQVVVFDPLIAAHVFTGTLILVLLLWRLALRMTHGVPPLPKEEAPILQIVAHIVHWGLYGLMFLMPVSGLLAWFGGIMAAANAHELMKGLMIGLVALHVFGALYHQLVLKTNIMARMKRSG